MSLFELKTTDNHDTIKNWVEERYGNPALIEGIVDKGKAGEMLRINFQNQTKESLKDISWDLFFEIFDRNNFALLYQEETVDGAQSKHFEFINREIGIEETLE